jgi:hypothetical protein
MSYQFVDRRVDDFCIFPPTSQDCTGQTPDASRGVSMSSIPEGCAVEIRVEPALINKPEHVKVAQEIMLYSYVIRRVRPL